jgi:hypothetical protein
MRCRNERVTELRVSNESCRIAKCRTSYCRTMTQQIVDLLLPKHFDVSVFYRSTFCPIGQIRHFYPNGQIRHFVVQHCGILQLDIRQNNVCQVWLGLLVHSSKLQDLYVSDDLECLTVPYL